jgi:hypothetical protein
MAGGSTAGRGGLRFQGRMGRASAEWYRRTIVDHALNRQRVGLLLSLNGNALARH